jgi:hypothetical protein
MPLKRIGTDLFMIWDGGGENCCKTGSDNMFVILAIAI